MTRAVLYARVSSDDTRKDGRNLAGQLDMGRERAAERGYSVVAELAEDDRGASGADWDLPQLSRILEMATHHEFDVLIVREIDRLSRSMAKQLYIEDCLKRAGVHIEYALAEYGNDPEGGLMKHVRAAVSEYERLKIVERNARGRELKVKAGSVIVNGHRPYGYRSVETRSRPDDPRSPKVWTLEINEAEAEIVRMVFDWYVAENGSISGIVKRLDALGVPTFVDNDNRGHPEKVRGRGEWANSTVRGMLRNEAYAGVWHWRRSKSGEDDLTVNVPAIVDREIWQRAQQRLDHNQKAYRGSRKNDYLLSGMLFCGHCNRRLVATTHFDKQKRPRAYYFCQARTRADYAPCPVRRTMYRTDQVEQVLWDWVKGYMLDDAQLAQGLADYQRVKETDAGPARARLQAIDRLLAQHRSDLERAVHAHVGGKLVQELLAKEAAQIERQIIGLERERSKIAERLEGITLSDERIKAIQQDAADAREGFEAGDEDPALRRRLLQQVQCEGTLSTIDGQRVLDATCILGAMPRRVLSMNSATRANRQSATAPAAQTPSPTRRRAVRAAAAPPAGRTGRPRPWAP